MAQTFVWPLYFAAKPLVARRLTLKKGQVFPSQDKFFIRGLGRAYGVPDADTIDFAKLPYVKVLNVGSEEMARQVLERNLTHEDAAKLVGAPTGDNA